MLRGCVDAPAMRVVSDKVQDQFGFAEARIVSFADLFAGKLVAALDPSASARSVRRACPAGERRPR